MTYVVVLPYVHQPFFEACMATVKFPRENMLIIDNTVDNIGIMRSHNRGIDFMRQHGADWLIIMSAAIRFGAPGGLDFIEQLEAHPDHYVIHAASSNVVGGKQNDGSEGGGVNAVRGWHLTAFHRDVFDKVGRWDENFSPYGFDDIDLSIRIQKVYKGAPGWDTFPIDVSDTIMSHSISLAKVKSPSAPRLLYFVEKWGRHPGAYQLGEYEYPFNNPEYPLKFWPSGSLVPAGGGKWDD